MAIVTRVLDDTFVETRSNDGRYIIRDDGIKFEIGLDLLTKKRTYTEGEKIQKDVPPSAPVQDDIMAMPSIEERMADAEAAICELYEMMIGE